MRILKTHCPECGAPSVIRKSEWKDSNKSRFADLYCACSDVECGHTFVMSLTFARTLSPSARGAARLAKNLLDQLNPSQKQYALDLLQAT